MNPPLISIVIPTFNRATLLSQAVCSCLNQDYPHIEIIVSDNHSSDETPTIMANLCVEHPQIKYVRNNENIGMVNNWRSAMNLVNGPWFCIMSDDDAFIDPTYLTRASAFFTDDSIGLIYADGKRLNQPQNIAVELSLPTKGKINGLEIFASRGKIQPQDFFLCNVIFNAQKSYQVWPQLFDDPHNVACDSELFLKICLDYDAAILAGPSVVYRFHPGNLTSTLANNFDTQWSSIKMFARLYELCLKKNSKYADSFINSAMPPVQISLFLFRARCSSMEKFDFCFNQLKTISPELSLIVTSLPTYKRLYLLSKLGSFGLRFHQTYSFALSLLSKAKGK